MKAWVLHGINDLQLSDVPMPTPKDTDVLVKVKAAGICSSDIPRIYTTGAYYYPIILGHEFSGITSCERRVGVFPLIPCHKCESCKTSRYETCSNYSYIGSRQNGAFAEYVVVPEWNLITLPDNMTFEQAALLEPAAVALHAVKRLDLCVIQSVLVVGNGVIGQLIARWLKIYGALNVTLIGRNDKPTLASYDACIEAAGNKDSFQCCIELAKPNGQVVLTGNPNVGFNIGQRLYWQILRKQLNVNGSWNSSYPSEWWCVLEYADKLRLDGFISHKCKFDELDKVFEMIHRKSEKIMKVIVVPD